MKEIEYIFLMQGVLSTLITLVIIIICLFTKDEEANINRVLFMILIAFYGLICFIVSFHVHHEVEIERNNAYKEYYKNTENMIDAIWELEPETFDKIDKSQYDTARNKVYKLNHANN